MRRLTGRFRRNTPPPEVSSAHRQGEPPRWRRRSMDPASSWQSGLAGPRTAASWPGYFTGPARKFIRRRIEQGMGVVLPEIQRVRRSSRVLADDLLRPCAPASRQSFRLLAWRTMCKSARNPYPAIWRNIRARTKRWRRSSTANTVARATTTRSPGVPAGAISAIPAGPV